VNGLRDDDTESTYQNRVSFASEYSVQEASNEGLQVMFKEHANAESRNSFTPPKALVNGKARPETKASLRFPLTFQACDQTFLQVFYISSANIGQLIENLSRDNEGGTINFSLPGSPVRRSNPSLSSEGGNHWTVEETLDHMLKSIGR
jgi:serine/arginine repetitive matrix protein 2